MSLNQISIYTEGMSSRNGTGFIFPILKNLTRLKDRNLQIKFHSSENLKQPVEADVIIVETQAIKNLYRYHQDELVELIVNAGNYTNRLVIYDLNDDSCTGYFNLLPYVDAYCKSYLLKDRSKYMSDMYGGRLWTQYYHEKYGITDCNQYINSIVTEKDDLKKLRQGYLLGLVDYSQSSVFLKGKKVRELLRRTGLVNFFLNGPRITDFTSPRKKRNLDLSCRISTSYKTKRESQTYHRKKIAEILSDRLTTSVIDRKKYYEELENSKLVISPFGWGEINVARDFEVAMAGSILVKPDLNHLETYPMIFNQGSTLQFKWDLSNLNDVINSAIENYSEYQHLAEELQNRYKFYMCTRDGQEEFSEFFVSMLSTA